LRKSAASRPSARITPRCERLLRHSARAAGLWWVQNPLKLPAPRLLGTSAAFGMFGTVGLLYYAGFVFWFQDYPRAGDLAGLGVTALLFVAAVVGMGLFAASFFRTRERGFQLIALFSLPMYFLAGVSWPVSAFPTPLVWLANLLPSTAGITAMVKFNQMGARIDEAGGELWNLALLALVYGGLAMWRYHPRRTARARAFWASMTRGLDAGFLA